LSSILELSNEELQRLLSCAGGPVIVACFTQSCGPCKRMLPMLEDLRRKFSNGLRIVRADVEKYPVIATTYDIAAVPALLIIVDGTVRERIVGVVVWNDLLRKASEYATVRTHDNP
jgi:thioredoxin 1